MARFLRLEVWSDYECAGGVRQAIVPDVVALQTTRDVAGDEGIQVTIPRNSAAIPYLVARAVLRVVRSGATYDEWRVTDLTDGSGLDATTCTYQAKSPLFDLARGDIAQVSSLGETMRSFNVVSLTSAQIIDTYVLPGLAAAGLTYFARGTVDSTATLDMTIEWLSPLALLQQIATSIAPHLELRVRRNGTAGYFIDLVTQIGAGAAMPSFRQRKNLLGNARHRQVIDQVTRVIPRGNRLPDSSEYHSIARVILSVTSVAGATIGVGDPAGAMTPIAFDDQFNGWYIFRQKTGTTFQILDTVKATQQLVLTTASTTLAAGEYLELRVSDAQNLRQAIPQISPRTGSASLPMFGGVSGVVPNRVTLTNANINFDGRYVDLQAVFTQAMLTDFNCNVNGAAGRFEFSVAITGLCAVGDLIYYGPSSLVLLWEVTAVDLANKYAYVRPYYTNRTDALPNDGLRTTNVARKGVAYRITTSLQATQEIDVDNATAPSAVTYGNAPVLIEQRCSGVFPTAVDDPVAVQAPPTGYGIIPRPLDKSKLRGEGNLIPNPRGRIWTNAVNPPDGWAVSSIGGNVVEHSQNPAGGYIKYGVRSWQVTIRDAANLKATTVTSPPFFAHPVNYTGLTRIAVKVSFYLVALDSALTFRLATGDNALGADLLTIYSVGYVGTIDDKLRFSPGGWYDITIPAIDLAWAGDGDLMREHGGYRLQVVNNGSSLAKLHLDAVAAFQVPYDPGLGFYPEGSAANQLLAAANAQLLANAQPAIEYATKIVDLERIPNSPWPEDALTLGGQIDLRDTDLSIVDTPRVTKMVIDEFDPTNTQLTLATQQQRLTQLLAEGAS